MKIPYLDPLVGIFANHHRRLFKYEVVSLDARLDLRKSAMDNSFTLGSNEEVDHVKILQSCSGLLLCSGLGSLAFFYIYNPSTNLFKRLLPPENLHDDSILHATGVFILAFDPTKSRDYKAVQFFTCLNAELEIQVYSSDTCNWRLCNDRVIYYNFVHFATSIYCNDAFHWLETEDMQLTIYKFHIDDHDYPIITTLKILMGCIREGTSYSLLAVEKSREFLLLVCRDDIDSKEFTIYKMVKECHVWTVRDDFGFTEFTIYEMMKGSFVWSVRKAVKYNLIFDIFDIGSNHMDDDDDAVAFIPPFEVDHNLYEFIPSLANM
nr:hypothetical protein [Tanacetum cinerariifolium]